MTTFFRQGFLACTGFEGGSAVGSTFCAFTKSSTLDTWCSASNGMVLVEKRLLRRLVSNC